MIPRRPRPRLSGWAGSPHPKIKLDRIEKPALE